MQLIILHCLKETTWDEYKNEKFYGEKYLELEGFIHCSDINTVHNVAPNFVNIPESLVFLCIDISKVEAEIRWEDSGNYGTTYPHIYGLLNLDAVINVLPFLKDDKNNFILNPELQELIL